MVQQIFRIPSTLAGWPWPRAVNPHYHEVKAESSAWLESFKAFDSHAQKSFNSCDFNLLASLAYPLASKDHLRTGCDLMNLFFVIDEYTDVNDEAHAAMVASVAMDALRNPFKPRPQGETVIGEIARQFWARTVTSITESSNRRFLETFDTYLQSVVVQASDRSRRNIRNIDDYLQMRRDNIGAKPSFAVLELSLDIPDYVMSHSSMRLLTTSTIDMLIIGNDLCSYKVEHARGDDTHNILTIAKHEFGQGLEQAVQWVESYHKLLRSTFLSAIENVPSWGEDVDEQVAQYLYGLANWVRANDCWSFESQRYFGKHGREIQRRRVVDLGCGHEACTVEVVDKPESIKEIGAPVLAAHGKVYHFPGSEGVEVINATMHSQLTYIVILCLLCSCVGLMFRW